ncbi:CHRD domain-containing protein [Polaribacter sp.]|uniref:CHRD domain-containing protein n=1 Tax=Polaribacter sp. TaxID=1920175 RepID=UPI003F6D15C3
MKKLTPILLLVFSFIAFTSCDNEDDHPFTTSTGMATTYNLNEKAVTGISGTARFIKNQDASVTVVLAISNTPAGGSHPAHIHANNAIEGGGIVISLNPVDGDTGRSVTTFSTKDDGSTITYEELLAFDGYINVHLSADNLSTIVAQGDIGENAPTENTITYDLGEKAVPGIAGNVTFTERVNGEILATIALANTPAGGSHPAHIHANTAAETGGILLSFNPVDGDSGMSATNLTTLDDGTAFTFSDIATWDAYVNVHLSMDNLATIVAQGDIGQNDLTSNTITYDLGEKAVPGIAGDVTFTERINGEILATIALANTPAGGSHPAHIHANTAAETGGILLSFNPVDGDSGMSATNLTTLDDGTAFTFSDIATWDAYVNVHLSMDNLATIVAQGDIGQNDLTGESKEYTLNEKDVPGISGTATFYQRVNGSALAVLNIMNTPMGGSHPAHIHENDIVTSGGIAFSFNPVNGDTGMSMTQVEALDNGTAITYDEILTYNGYINVHLSLDNLATIVAQGNIGANE